MKRAAYRAVYRSAVHLRARLEELERAHAEGFKVPALEEARRSWSAENERLAAMASAHYEGRWGLRVPGVGPLNTVGLLGFVDPEAADTPSQVWRFAALDPAPSPLRLTRRGQGSYSLAFRHLTRRILHNFLDPTLKPNPYGRLYRNRVRELWQKNLEGGFVEKALRISSRYREGAAPHAWLSGRVHPEYVRKLRARGHLVPARLPAEALVGGHPMLPPFLIDAYAQRGTLRIFLEHYWELAYLAFYGTRPVYPKGVYGRRYIPPLVRPEPFNRP